jgi:glycosyltransferase involved in cell wall biosynthesis
VPTYVEDGVSGSLLPPEADAEAWADAIEALLDNPARYQAQSVAARAAFDTRLNWNAWALRLDSLLTDAGI